MGFCCTPGLLLPYFFRLPLEWGVETWQSMASGGRKQRESAAKFDPSLAHFKRTAHEKKEQSSSIAGEFLHLLISMGQEGASPNSPEPLLSNFIGLPATVNSPWHGTEPLGLRLTTSPSSPIGETAFPFLELWREIASWRYPPKQAPA